MSPEKRSALMSRIRSRDTHPEKAVARALEERCLEWEGHAKDLPGRPDFVFRNEKIAIFVEGDFWHGWQFPRWRHKLSLKWDLKIDGNRKRDQRNHGKLRRQGWKVIRVWEHQIKKDIESCVTRITEGLDR